MEIEYKTNIAPNTSHPSDHVLGGRSRWDRIVDSFAGEKVRQLCLAALRTLGAHRLCARSRDLTSSSARVVNAHCILRVADLRMVGTWIGCCDPPPLWTVECRTVSGGTPADRGRSSPCRLRNSAHCVRWGWGAKTQRNSQDVPAAALVIVWLKSVQFPKGWQRETVPELPQRMVDSERLWSGAGFVRARTPVR